MEQVTLRETPDPDIPRHSYRDLARRWGVSEWTVRLWVRKGELSPPVYLSAVKARFTERQVREFEQSRPTRWKDTQRPQGENK